MNRVKENGVQSFDLCSALTASRKLLSTKTPGLSSRISSGIKEADLYLKPCRSNKGNDRAMNTAATPGLNNICAMEIDSNNEGLLKSNLSESKKSKKRKVTEIQPNLDNFDISEEIQSKKKDERLDQWFGIPKQKMTPETMRELKAIQLRGFADPKHFFKSTDFKKMPTHFHFATVIDHGKGVGEDSKLFTRKHKPKSLMNELLKNEQIRLFTHRKALKLQMEAESGGKNWYRQQYKRRKRI